MFKEQLTKKISDRTGYAASDVAEIVNAFCAVVQEAVGRGEDVQITRFGTFRRSARVARKSKSITGGMITIPAHNTVVFSPGSEFKKAVNPPPAKRGRGRPRKNSA